MTRIRANWVAALTIAAAIVVSVVAAAQPGPFGGGRRGDRSQGPQLQLSEEQRSQIHSLMEQQRETGGTAMKQLRDLQRQLNAEIFADTPDLAKIDGLKIEIAKAEADVLAARIDLQMRIAQMLTAEQRQQMRDAPGGFPLGRFGRGREPQ